MADLKVTQVRSAIGAKPKTRGTLRALGLRRIGMSNTLPDRPEIRGMIARVPHLVRVDSVDTSRSQAELPRRVQEPPAAPAPSFARPTGGAGSDNANPSVE